MGKGKRVAVKAEEAVEFTQAELITLLQSTDKKLETLLGTKDIIFDERLKVVLGAIDDSDPTKIRTLFDDRGRLLTRDDLIETEMYDLRRRCLNGAVNAGPHSIKIEPAAKSILLVDFIGTVNQDAAAVNHTIGIYTAAAALIAYLAVTVGLTTGVPNIFPRGYAGQNYLGSPTKHSLMLTDAFELLLYTASVAINEETYFFVSYSWTGDAPTITETGPAGSTFSDIA